MIYQYSPVTNSLLAALPPEDRQHFVARCELVDLKVNEVLDNAGDLIKYAYFPLNGLISLGMPMLEESNLEISFIGNEGMHGITLMLEVENAPFLAIVQNAGSALRIPKLMFIHELEKNLTLKRELKRYLYVLMSQLAQAAGCHRYHIVEERLARLLLMIRDKTHSSAFYITQDLLAKMLGVRRVGVTKAARVLQQNSLISYSRGRVSISNPSGLERASCGCYLADKEIYEHILKH